MAPAKKPDKKPEGELEALMESLQSRFGEGAVMRLGAGQHAKVETVSSGSFSLDLALGVGGLPKGRIIEIFGPESSGKCVKGDSIVFSEAGMLPIDAFGHLVIPGFQKKEIFVYSEHSFEKTSHFYNQGLKPTIKTETRYGFSIEGTPNHQIRVLDKSGNYLFKRLDEIRNDDHVVIQRGQDCFGQGADTRGFVHQRKEKDKSSKRFVPPETISKDWAPLMGYLVGDGTLTKRGLNENNIQFTCGDEEIEKDFGAVCKRLFGEYPKVTKDKRTKTTKRLAIYYAQARAFLAYIGLGWGKAGEKEIPWSILCSPKKIVSAFLSALFECDGSFSGNTIEYCTKSEKLAHQLHVVLLNYGIVAKKKIRMVKKMPYYYLYIDGQNDKKLFAKEIGFRSKRKNTLLNANVARRAMPQTNVDVIPNVAPFLLKFFEAFNEKIRLTNRSDWKVIYDYLPHPRGKEIRLSYDRLNKILKHFNEGRNLPEYQELERLQALWFFFDPIKTVTKSHAHVVDFTIPKTATFFANGFVNHNTTLALHAVAEAQKKGGKAAFIDAEHALDPEYAGKIGVHVKDLIISQPDNGEEALNILESLVRSGIISVVVVDSVAALTPRAEIEGEMGAQHMGLQARLMSQALRKLTAIAAKSGTIVIFINQTRMKIGIVYGNPETTPGGMALKFYASVRIDIRRTAQIKKGEEAVGNRVRAKVAKNKVASPFKVAEFDIMYGQGISYEGDVLNTAVKYGVVTKSGASYSFGEEKLGVGFDNIREKLKGDKKLLDAIKQKAAEAAEKKGTVGGGEASEEKE